MPSLRFYNVISIAIYGVTLALLYTSLPVTDIAYYLASVSLNLVPHLVKYEIRAGLPGKTLKQVNRLTSQ